MKLSIVIICWNDLKVITDCLRSIFEGTHSTEFEVLVSDNGSTDGSVEFVRENYPAVKIVENGANLGFAKGNNAGICQTTGDYVLILNPDTIIHDGSLDRWIAFADRHPNVGGFGCRVQNPDGSYQISARPFPTIGRYWIAALYVRFLGRLSDRFVSDLYPGWKGDSERNVDWQSGCCLMLRGDLLRQQLRGFDEQFFYHFEEVDLCKRVWDSGSSIRFTPEATITHLGGQSVGRFPTRFEIEKLRNRYRYFYKYYGEKGCHECRAVTLAWFRLRQLGYGLFNFLTPSERRTKRLEMYKVVLQWNRMLDPVVFVESGREPVVNLNPTAQPV
jgi:GT2 family glycosyltransferase